MLAALPNQSNTAGVLFDDFVYGATAPKPSPGAVGSFKTLQNMSTATDAMGKDVFLCLYTHELLTMTAAELLPYLKLGRRPMLWMANMGLARVFGAEIDTPSLFVHVLWRG